MIEQMNKEIQKNQRRNQLQYCYNIVQTAELSAVLVQLGWNCLLWSVRHDAMIWF